MGTIKTFYLPVELAQQMDAMREKNGTNWSRVICAAVREKIEGGRDPTVNRWFQPKPFEGIA